MKKLLLSILLSAFLSLILGFSIDRVVKEDWKMELSYDHIRRDLDVDFSLLENYVALGSADKFNNFVSQSSVCQSRLIYFNLPFNLN